MLDEFLQQDKAKPGDTIMCMVPESGRFNVAYIHLTVVEE
jgi:3-oxoacyl-[acyl-carrier-protein] synthase-3